MGCCLSRNAAPSKAKPGPTVGRFEAREPPPEPEEPQEETVKEVLSETPARAREEGKPMEAAEKRDAGRSPVIACDEISEASTNEICSLSESQSVSNTLTEEKGEAEAEADASGEIPPASFRRKRPASVEPVGKSDGRVGVGCGSGRSSPSPARRREGPVGRTLSARDPEQSARSRVPPVRNGSRREPGKRPGRRPMSPAVKRAADQRYGDGHCRSLSAARVNGQASPHPIPTRGLPDGAGCMSREPDVGSASGPTEGKESLENPLVSLECFIFL